MIYCGIIRAPPSGQPEEEGGGYGNKLLQEALGLRPACTNTPPLHLNLVLYGYRARCGGLLFGAALYLCFVAFLLFLTLLY